MSWAGQSVVAHADPESWERQAVKQGTMPCNTEMVINIAAHENLIPPEVYPNGCAMVPFGY